MDLPKKFDYASLPDIQAWARAKMQKAPDFIIGEPETPYMRRWWIIPRNEACNVYLHEILRSDDDRARHDHPWDNRSFVIEGEYTEIAPVDQAFPQGDTVHLVRRAGDQVVREATDAHRLVLPEGVRAVSLFFTGPKVREWGFWCEHGWRHWMDFTAGVNGETVGQGCE